MTHKARLMLTLSQCLWIEWTQNCPPLVKVVSSLGRVGGLGTCGWRTYGLVTALVFNMKSGLSSFVYLHLEVNNLSYFLLILTKSFFFFISFNDKHCAKYLTCITFLILTIILWGRYYYYSPLFRKNLPIVKLHSQCLNQSLSDSKAQSLTTLIKPTVKPFTLPIDGSELIHSFDNASLSILYARLGARLVLEIQQETHEKEHMCVRSYGPFLPLCVRMCVCV